MNQSLKVGLSFLVIAFVASNAQADIFTDFGALVNKIAGEFLCSKESVNIFEAVVKCRDEFEAEKASLSDPAILSDAGCCLYGRFQHCVNHKIDKLCTKAAANITETAMEYFKIFVSSDCKKDDQKPRYPSFECDVLLFPEKTWLGIGGLIMGAFVLGTMCATICYLTCTMVRRRGYHSYI